MPPFANVQSQDVDEISIGESSFCVEAPEKSVRIDVGLNEVCHIPPITEMTSAEISKTWVSRDESTIIRSALIKSIDKLNNGDNFDEKSDTTRGLEYFSYNGSLKRECNKLRLKRTVLEEQRRQRQAGICDAEKLALAAANCAVECTEFALDIAEEDEDFVYDEIDEYEDEIFLKQASALRPALSLCCWDYGLLCIKRWR